jgi:hypothetical protein
VTMSRPTLIVVLLVALLAGCSGDDDTGGSAQGGATTTTAASPDGGVGGGGGGTDAPDPCTVLTTDEIAAVLDPGAREPVTIEQGEFRTLAECNYTVSNTFVGASHINIRLGPARDAVGDRIDDARGLAEAEFDDVEDVAGLGDEAFWYYDGVLGPQLWVRAGDLALTVGFGRFETDAGMDRGSQEAVARQFVDTLG